MAKFLVVLFSMCVVPSIVSAHFMAPPLLLKGQVYCDTCRCGYETSASKPLAGAFVRVECRNRTSSELTYTNDAVTGPTGHYKIVVYGDRGEDVCDALLVKSPDPKCNTPSEGRDRARVILTGHNGINSNYRYANSMGFDTNTPLASCPQILQQYQEADSED